MSPSIVQLARSRLTKSFKETVGVDGENNIRTYRGRSEARVGDFGGLGQWLGLVDWVGG